MGKKSTVYGMMSLFLMVNLTFIPASATQENSEKTEAEVEFVPGKGSTTPLDPENPDKQINPEEPLDPQDSNNFGTGKQGPLTLDYISNIKFGRQKIEESTKIYKAINYLPHIQVTDTRGTGEGWSVTTSISEFTGVNKEDEKVVLKGAILSFKNGIVKSQSKNTSERPTTNEVVFDNTFEKSFFKAALNAGEGSWLNVFDMENVTLKVFGKTAEAGVKYNAKLNWTLLDAPQ